MSEVSSIFDPVAIASHTMRGSPTSKNSPNVGPKGADALLLRLGLQLDLQGFAEDREVLLAGQPRGEILGLGRPRLPELDSFKTTELLHAVRLLTLMKVAAR